MTKPDLSDAVLDVAINDSGLTPSQIRRVAEMDGIEIVYGNFRMLTHPATLAGARRWVAELSAEECPKVMVSVDRALRRAVRRVNPDRPKKTLMDDLHADLCIWTALRERVL